MKRCVNIDWLECYCLESADNFPHDAAYFTAKGYFVKVRDYGTRQYCEMFTVCDSDGEDFIEVRRKPVSGSLAQKVRGIFSPYSCHLRLSNRYCYHEQAVDLYADFLYKHGYTVQRIFRIDIALDFEKFDDGTDPNDFMLRYLKHRYTKINESEISAHGHDTWGRRIWNSLSWGNPRSMVSTKFYNKTLELKQKKDKPYIRYAWMQSELVSDWVNLVKVNPDGSAYQPIIWRVEFSIKSSAKGWARIEPQDGSNEEWIENTLDCYDTREKLLQCFASLARHYFHFKKYEEGKRKSLCEDRVTWKFTDKEACYKLDRLMTARPQEREINVLKRKLEIYRQTHFDEKIRQACTLLIADLDSQAIREAIPTYNRDEVQLLQQLLTRRLKFPQESIEEAMALLEVEKNLFKDAF